MNAAVFVGCIAFAVAAILANAPGWYDPEWAHSGIHMEERSGWISFSGGRDGNTNLFAKLTLPNAGADGLEPKDNLSPAYRRPPVVILAQGLGLSQDCGLDAFVKAFTESGFATLTFDYATFGASSGGGGIMPRHTVDPKTHISDLLAALAAVQSRSDELGIDGSRVALWGSSLGGGHALSAAAALSGDESVKAVVAQVPHLASGFETVLATVASDPRVYLPALAKVAAGLLKGCLLGLVGRPWYLPLHGPPGSAAAMQNPGDDEGYKALCPHDGGLYDWRNGMTSGSSLRALMYRPLNRVSKIRVPVLFVMAENDTLCSAAWARKAASRMAGATVEVLSRIGHFDVYSGKPLSTALQRQVAFLKKHLG